jgi:predicted RND superfamily exporter protein
MDNTDQSSDTKIPIPHSISPLSMQLDGYIAESSMLSHSQSDDNLIDMPINNTDSLRELQSNRRQTIHKRKFIDDKDRIIKQKDLELIDKDNDRDKIIKEKDSELKDNNNDWNTYATSKSVSQNLLNTTSITGQITLLVMVYSKVTDVLTGFQTALIVLIITSLFLQFVIFVLLVVLAQSTDEKICGYFSATNLNSLVTSLTGLLLILGAAISAVNLKSDI